MLTSKIYKERRVTSILHHIQHRASLQSGRYEESCQLRKTPKKQEDGRGITTNAVVKEAEQEESQKPTKKKLGENVLYTDCKNRESLLDLKS